MKVRLARTAGFCMGVRRAMELALSAAREQGTGQIRTYGPLIHNPQVLELLQGKGIGAIKDLPAADSQGGGTVIIRAHGVPPADKERLKAAGFTRVVDGTCPRVIKVQAIIRRAAKRGASVVIVGDADHPEVRGLKGHAGDRGYVVAGPEDVVALPELSQVVAVAQTTQSGDHYEAVLAALRARFGGVEAHQTICEATHRRQNEVRRLAAEVDGVVVVGGRESGNTKRLTQLAEAQGRPTFLVETEADLDRQAISRLGSVGVTAGASTPNWMIKKMVREISAIRSHRESRAMFWARRAFRFLVRSQALVALGAAGITMASTLLQGLAMDWVLMGAAFFYIYAMHILNHFLDKEAGQYNEPDRAQFLAKHRGLLIGFGVFAATASLGLCALLGAWPFALVLVMSVLGLLYSVPIIPRRWERRLSIHRLKDIPGSKTASAALAWAFIVAVLPAVEQMHFHSWGTPLAFAYALILVFARCALFDILDVQGDLIVGKETIPIVLGEKGTLRLLTHLNLELMAALILLPALGLAPSLALGLTLPVLGLLFMQRLLVAAQIMPGAFSEGLVDLNFLLAGAVAMAWHGLAGLT